MMGKFEPESPIFHGKNHGFLVQMFPTKPPFRGASTSPGAPVPTFFWGDPSPEGSCGTGSNRRATSQVTRRRNS